MAAIISVTPPAGLASKDHKPNYKYNRFAAWHELVLGKGPLWWRIVVWSQRRNAA